MAKGPEIPKTDSAEIEILIERLKQNKLTHGNQKHKNGPFDRVHKAPGLSFFRSLIFEFEEDIFPCPPYMKPLIHA
jgi:hypothetical protein